MVSVLPLNGDGVFVEFTAGFGSLAII